VSRRALLLLLILVALPVFSQQAIPTFVIVDSSYSMSLSATLPDASGPSRLAVLTAGLADYLADPARAGRSFALIAFEDEGEVAVKAAYPARPESILAATRRLEPWGTTDAGAAVEYALLYARRVAPGRRIDLLVVSDLEDDRDYLRGAPVPPPRALLDPEVSLSLLTIDPEGAAASRSLLSWVTASGGQLLTVAEGGLASRSAPAGPAGLPRDGHEIAPTQESLDIGPSEQEVARMVGIRALSSWLVVARWNFAAAALLGIAGVVLGYLRWRRRRDAALRHNAEPTRVVLEARSRTGRSTHTLDRFPASVGTASRCTWYLGKAAGPSRGSFSLNLEDGDLTLTSRTSVLVNGVPRKTWNLREGDQVRLDRYRVTVTSILVPELLPLPPRHFIRLAPVPLLALTAALLLFLLRPFDGRIVKPTVDMVRREMPAASSAENPVAGGSDSGREGADALPITPPLTAAGPRVVAPGERIPVLNADYIAIHAHPDDETLDFGVLLARMNAAGMRGAVVLLTDGQSGRDQYPRREVGGIYPAYDLTGSALVRARVSEARDAMRVLGVGHYLRLGLPNHPYNSITDELSPSAVMESWGGRDIVAGTLADIIAASGAQIILSPDGPAATYEHFEHEATGELVAEALRILAERGTPVGAHLVAVDPLQTAAYNELLAVDPWEIEPRTGSPYRAIQLQALLAHKTQRDASVVGVETRLAVRAEYYAVKSWDDSFAPPAALGLSMRAEELSAIARPSGR
jgi:LmbE family N-acetylglucosaminyl deacetylase